MIIRDQQLTTLRRERFQDFSRRLIAHLRKHHGQRLAACTDEGLVAYVRECAERAERLYDLTTEQAIACYAELPLVLHNNYEIDENYLAIPALLGKRSFHPSTRAKLALSLAYQVKPAKQNVW